MLPRYLAILFFTVFFATPSVAQETHSHHCLHGCPAGAPQSNDLIIREIYILSSNDLTKFADWAAYKITDKTIGPTAERVWKPDPYLSDEETLEPKDYKGAHAKLKTDRGHQVPLASFTGTPYWKATNFLSNITPQSSSLNQGPWVKLENAVRNLIKEEGFEAVFVMTGPLYERRMSLLPGADEAHLVPSGYWKIISAERQGKLITTAFYFDQETERKANFCNEKFITSVRSLEERTGLNFFHALTC